MCTAKRLHRHDASGERSKSIRYFLSSLLSLSKCYLPSPILINNYAIVPVKFYEFLGMKHIQKLSFPENKFDLLFLAYDDPDGVSAHWTDRQGVLELTHNYGSENDDSFKIANGNSDPGRGFGHVCVVVDHIQAACRRIEDAGYGFQTKLHEDGSDYVAFALDPDGYWVDIHEISARR